MALPKVPVPTYSFTLPLSKQSIECRPFLVSEEKILLLASETKDIEQIYRDMKMVVTACTFNKIDIDKIASVDLQYLFLNLRAKSVGEKFTPVFECNSCKKDFEVNIHISDIKLNRELQASSNIVKLTDDMGLRLKYPNYSSSKNILKTAEARTNKESSSENTDSFEDVIDLLVECIEEIYDKEQVFTSKDFTKEELLKFIQDMPNYYLLNCTEFIQNIPKLVFSREVNCPHCQTKMNLEIDNFDDFFISA